VVATLFVSSIALAIIARIMPQMNVWMVGMPMKIAVGILTLMFSLPLMWQAFAKQQGTLQTYWIGLMRLMGGA
jgi:flagellar biosynthetic protein FliR